MDIDKKLDILKQNIKNMGSVLVVLSGDTASALLLKLSKELLGIRAVSAAIDSYIYPQLRIKISESLAHNLGVEHMRIPFDPIKEVAGFESSYADRCLKCRKAVFSKVLEYAENAGVNYVADSLCADDVINFKHYVIDEPRIKNPFVDVELSRGEVIKAAKGMGLSTDNVYPFSCLMSRIPHGEEINRKKLTMIDNAEMYISSKGINNAAVMCHGTLARIVVPEQEMKLLYDMELMKDISETLKGYGFKFVSLDMSFKTQEQELEIL